MNRQKKNRTWNESGQVLIIAALSMVILLGFVGFATDVGYLRFVKRNMQKAADAAAIAGASELIANKGVFSAGVTAAAQADALKNGFTNDTVTVSNPQTGCVEVDITQPQPTFFMKALNITSATVSAMAVAGEESSAGCIYVLNPSASKAFQVSGGNPTVNCGIYVNSESSSGFYMNGGNLTHKGIGVVASSYTKIGGNLIPATNPTTSIAAQTNPLSNLQAPSVTSCDHPTKVVVSGGTNNTLSPGVYCGGITISGGTNTTFKSGTYILNGGGLTISGGSPITGNGVTFFNTGTASTYAPINISGANGTLQAPTSGSLAGILFFQDPKNTQTATLSGGNFNFEGALYFPTAALNYSGGNTNSTYSIIVADKVNLSGGNINAKYPVPSGSPIQTAVLVE